MPQLIESKRFLPDFVTLTNYCESKGYFIEFIRSKKGVTCDIYLNDELIKVGGIVFDTCINAQKECYEKIYSAITKG
jgi:hypothetical protein